MGTVAAPLAAPADVTPIELGQLYMELHHHLHRIVDQAMGEAGLTLARAKVLMRLHDRGPMNQATLAGLLGFAPRSVTETVDALERDGLVTRTEDPRDRRARIVALTATGDRAYETSQVVRRTIMNQIFGALDESQRAALAELLAAVRDTVTPGDETQ